VLWVWLCSVWWNVWEWVLVKFGSMSFCRCVLFGFVGILCFILVMMLVCLCICMFVVGVLFSYVCLYYYVVMLLAF